MCLVDLEKVYDHVPRGTLQEVLWENGVPGRESFSPCIMRVRTWSQRGVRYSGLSIVSQPLKMMWFYKLPLDCGGLRES